MFPMFEGTNGRTDRRIEPDLTTMLERLTPEVIAALARKHGIAPNGPAPHRKALTAGSDDHGDRRAATVYTEVDGADLDPAAFLRGCMAGLGRTAVSNVGNVERQAHLATMATCVSHTRRGIKGRLLGMLARRAPGARRRRRHRRRTGSPAADSRSSRAALPAGGGGQDPRYPRRRDRRSQSVRRPDGGRPGAVRRQPFRQAGVAGTKAARQWTAFPLPAPERRLALFSDSLEQVDGVSTWCKRFVARARAAGHTVLLPQCCPNAGDDQVPAVTSFAVPLYPCMRFHVPSLTRALEWAWRQRVTHIELATPGPMGLAGL